jgi:hypothetical protein
MVPLNRRRPMPKLCVHDALRLFMACLAISPVGCRNNPSEG